MPDAPVPNSLTKPTSLALNGAKIAIGDWICFQDGGSLAYGQVEYLFQAGLMPTWYLATSHGLTTWEGIREVRARGVVVR